ncbi:extracellular solute-binding protein [Streptomyces sp. NBC_00347]|uniref:extracellular solute-binding protein n=1 Tax=Streptomyces sp. NBC_00347 TaxID=2975721 RepID=UPI002259B164|nr:extracellular solute-binding protein [Streptomyces sp. NBC_00347]MCX5126726.1 extracellular solute-binding protein [Streptomyces sp. NBC_00347]
MPRHRHALTAAATALVLSVSSAGCADSHEGPVTLRLVAADYEVGGQSDSTEQYWDALITAFEAAHPGIKVEVEVVSWDSVDRKVAGMVEEGEAPDLAQIGAYADYAKRGELYAAESLLSVRVQANFLRPFSTAGEQGTEQYGMPFAASTRLLFYNEELFAKAGVAQPPRTWDELKSVAHRLKSRTGVRYPMAVPLGPEEAQMETMAWMLGGGGGYTSPSGSYAISSEENVDSLDWLKANLVKEGLTGPVSPEQLNRKEAYAAFLRGEVGMVNGFPSLLQDAQKAGIKVGTVAVPGRDAKTPPAPGVVDWIMAFKRNGHPEELGTFLNFVFSDENVREFATRNNLLPVTMSVTGQMRAAERYRDLWKFLDELPASQLPPVNKTSWTLVSASTKRNIGSAMTPGGSPAKALRQIADDAKKAESGR